MKKDASETRQKHMTTLGQNIRRIRIEQEMSQEQLANLCGHTNSNARSWISKIESGTNDPPASELKLIAKALGVSCVELMKEPDGSQEKKKACELFKKCYGQDAFRLVQYFLELNPKGQEVLLDYAEALSGNEKYFSVKKESSGSLAMRSM